jgi:hypothetical protein
MKRIKGVTDIKIFVTAKKEAEEIVEKFIQTNGNSFFAKECALIAVDEILKVAFYTNDEIYEHYIQVKQEIEKL